MISFQKLGLRTLTVTVLCASLTAAAQAQTDGQEDESVRTDRAELERVLGAAAGALALTRDAGIEIEFIGKGEVYEGPVPREEMEAAPALTDEPGAAIGAMRAFNPETQNEFEIRFGAGALAAFGRAAERDGLHLGNAGPGAGEAVEDPVPDQAPGPDMDDGASRLPLQIWPPRAPAIQRASWSNNSDDRARYTALNQQPVGWPRRAIAHLGNNCTGTLIGPRHLLTAGHCIWSRRNSAWSTGFTITPGRSGANQPFGQITFPAAGGFNWYFTPAEWRQASPAGGSRQYDFGILVLPERMGERTGWMGWWIEAGATINDHTIRNRGYPWCNARDSAGNARIDDPGDPGSDAENCRPNHMYGDENECVLGNFRAQDPDNWSRLVSHSCDASAGQSGSPVYLFPSRNVPAVTAVHVASSCGTTALATPCTASDTRPLTALRITPEYGDIIAFFRSWRP